MNSENFHNYLKNPSMLHQVSYQELKSLVLQYPYAPNLRYLLLIKSLFDQHREYDRNLVMASLASIDRQKLRHLVAQYLKVQEIQENFSLEEEFLELKDLAALENLPAESTPPPAEMVAPPPSSVESISDENEEMDEFEMTVEADGQPETDDLGFLDELFSDTQPAPTAEEPESDGSPAASEIADDTGSAGSDVEILEELFSEEPAETAEDEPVADLAPETIEEDFSLEELLAAPTTPPEPDDALDDLEEMPDEGTMLSPEHPSERLEIPLEILNDLAPSEEEVVEAPTGGPAPVPELDDWLARLKPPKKAIFEAAAPPELHPVEEHQPDAAPGPEPADTAKEVAANSILEDADIATETLAGILERQGHYDKAIAMYKRLSLKFPEKSSFFAAKIKALKKLK